MALKPGAEGDVGGGERDERSFLAWRTEPGGPYTTTPLAYRDLLYAVRDEGVLGVYEVKTGALVYRERTGTTHSASPVASDGRSTSRASGQLLVLRAGGDRLRWWPARHGRTHLRHSRDRPGRPLSADPVPPGGGGGVEAVSSACG
jgi:hypothetical protein